MRRLNYSMYIKNLRLKSLQLYTDWAGASKHPPHRQKPRAPEEDVVLFLLDKRRWETALKTRRLEKIGPRRYRWNG